MLRTFFHILGLVAFECGAVIEVHGRTLVQRTIRARHGLRVGYAVIPHFISAVRAVHYTRERIGFADIVSTTLRFPQLLR